MSDDTEVAVAAPEAETASEAPAGGAEAAPKPRRRRRRGGRGRGRRKPTEPTEGAAGPEPEGESTGTEVSGQTEAGEGAQETAPRKRRRRRRGGRGRKRPTAETEGLPEAGQEARRAGEEAESEAQAAEREAEPGRARAEAKPKAKPAKPKAKPAKPKAKPAKPKAKPAKPEAAKPEAEAEAKPRRRRARPRKEKVEEQAKPEAGAETREAAAKGEEAEAPAPTRVMRTRLKRRSRTRREALPVIPRVTDKGLVITEHGERDQIAVLENRDLVQHYVTRTGARSLVGNVYLGRVQNVLPGMEAAFVDLGRGRNAVLYAGEVNYSAEDLEGGTPRIEQVLKSGQAVMVQVTKDPMGGKGPRLTAQISMPGRYLVLVPNSDVWGISRRIPVGERRRLRNIGKRVKPDGHGLIVRTAAEGVDEEAVAEDLGRLLKTWAEVERKAKRSKAPHVLYEEPELTVRVVRDLFTEEEFRELVTDSPRIAEKVSSYLREVAPDLVEKVRLHDGKLPVFEEFHVVEQIHKALERKVWLPSGGYVIIERTEAMTVIDVNTGKHVGRRSLEETVVTTNLEAAREIARQLRLRDIGGIIIIDFIDMLLEENKQNVIDSLREALAQDKTRSQVFDISPLGLLEVTRKRVSGGLVESFSETCPTCEGRGILLTYEA